MKLTTWARIGTATMLLVPSLALAANESLTNVSNNPFKNAGVATENVGTSAKINEGQTDLTVIVGRIINILLSFLGIIFLVLVLYAGFLWMTAQGDSKKVDQARGMISQAIVGLIIIMASYAISNYVLNALAQVTTTA